MKIDELIEGLTRLRKYRPDTFIEAGHEVIWFCDSDVVEELSEEDAAWFEANNWGDVDGTGSFSSWV